MESKPLKVAIIGGGIGGLSFALSIAKLVPNYDSHLDIDIYESTSSLKAQVGAGLGLWPNAWAVYEVLGVDKKLAECGMGPVTNEPVDLFVLRRADRTEGRDVLRIKSTCGANVFFHRADFQGILLDSIPPSIRIHTQKRLRTYVQNDAGVELLFEDGTSAFANFVVGADGLQSRVRKTLIDETAPADAKHLADPSWTGTVCYRSMIPRQKLVDAGWPDHRAFKEWTIHYAKGASVMSYPVRKGEFVTFVGLRIWPEYEGAPFSQELFGSILEKEGYTRPRVKMEKADQQDVFSNERDPWSDNGGGGRLSSGRSRWVCEAEAAEVRNSFSGFEPEVQALLDGVNDPLAWAVHRVGPLKTYISGNVCLLGDAAHATYPQQGAGAGQAVVDGYILASLLASAVSTNPLNVKSHLGDVLHAYNTVRRHSGRVVSESSRANCFHFCGYVQVGDGDRLWKELDIDDKDEVKILQERITHRWLFAWDKEGPKKEAEKAMQILQERIRVGVV